MTRKIHLKQNIGLVNIISHVYQILYFLKGDRASAKSFYQEHAQRLNFIHNDLLMFEPSIELEEFIDNIPLNHPVNSILTKEKSIINLVRMLKLYNLLEKYELFEDVFNEVLNYAKEVEDPLEKKILLSFVSDFDKFITISAYNLQVSINVPSKELYMLFPENLIEQVIIYNQYVNVFSGIKSETLDQITTSFATPFLELFGVYNSSSIDPNSKISLSFQISSFKSKNGVNIHLNNAYLNGREQIKISYGEIGGNEDLIFLKGNIIKGNICNNEEILVNVSNLNLTEKHLEYCEKINCAGISKELLKDQDLISIMKLSVYKGYINLNLLNVIRLSYLNSSQLSDFSTLYKLKSYQPFDYETEAKSLFYWYKMVSHSQDLDSEYLYDDIKSIYNIFSKLRTNKNLVDSVPFLARYFTFYTLAKERKEVLNYNYNYILDEMRQRLVKEMVRIKEKNYK
jgi:hypothetical protein